ncbi:hypothetical protein D6810_01000 [Candidatus Dojkabacteria bacterium]|uniref:Uncharacterized protein n=1 Tax=Candidatus Dojkabacteria bacterium TaxID=2099670 RepID=A0A3M0Z0X3_9BACT|nr:MAG: hypothetical protein D6810_01000 [Candidatus Dojkabacteria bacterium]
MKSPLIVKFKPSSLIYKIRYIILSVQLDVETNELPSSAKKFDRSCLQLGVVIALSYVARKLQYRNKC